MTTSFREEIIKIIEFHLQGNETGIDGQEEAADDILKLVEKRIDMTIVDIKRDMEFVSKQNLKDDKSNSVQLHHIYKLKELLK